MDAKKVVHNMMGFFTALALVSVLIFGIVFSLSQLVDAFAWETIFLDDDGVDYDTGYSIAVASEPNTDVAHIAYCQQNHDRLRYVAVENSVTTTKEDYIIESDFNCSISIPEIDIAYDGTQPVFAFGNLHDSARHLTVGFRDGGGNGSDCPGTGGGANWSCYDVTSSASSAYQYISMDVYTGGENPTYGIAYHRTNATYLYFSTCSSDCSNIANWTHDVVDASSTIVGRHASLAYTGDGVPVISYVDTTLSFTKYAIRNGEGAGNCTNPDWNCYVVDDGYRDPVGGTSIAVNSLGKIGIAYRSELGESLIKYAYQDGGDTGCDAEGETTFTCQVASGATQGHYPSLTFVQNRPLISWGDTSNLALHFTYLYQGEWSGEEIDADSNGAQFTDIAHNNENDVYIAYLDTSGNEAKFTSAPININDAPTVDVGTPAQVSATYAYVTTTISDNQQNVSSLLIDYSTDGGSTWASSTLGTVDTNGEGSVSTSTGQITSIDTDTDGSVLLGIYWNIATDIPNTATNTVILRFKSSDNTDSSDYVTSSLFSVDTLPPTAPGALIASATTTQSVLLTFGTTSTEDSFLEYKIHYSTSTPVLSSDPAMTSSTDANLGSITFGGAATTTLTGLATNTLYYVKTFAYDEWGNVTSSASETLVYTRADVPDQPTVITLSAKSQRVTLDTSNNPSNTEYLICTTAEGTSCSNYVGSDGVLSGSETWATSTVFGGGSGIAVTGMSTNTAYSFMVQARNGENVTTTYSASTTALYTYAAIPTNQSATAASQTAITVTWSENNNPSGTEFYVVDASLSSRNSGWITSTTTEFTGLTCGTSYSFEINARNGNQIQTLAVVASASTSACDTGDTGGGGGGSGPSGGGDAGAPAVPPPAPKDCQPKVDPACSDFTPTGLITVSNAKTVKGVKYINSPDLVLAVKTNYGNQVALTDSAPDPGGSFELSTFQSIQSFIPWTLPNEDGKHCVNAKFKYVPQQGGTGWQTDQPIFTCVILDQVAPNVPKVITYRSGVDEGNKKIIRPPYFSGEGEPNSFLIVALSQPKSGLAGMLHLAADLSTYIVPIDSSGNWEFQFFSFLDAGEYQVSFAVEDYAGNTSNDVLYDVTIPSYDDPCDGPNPPPICTQDVCSLPNPPTSCFPPDTPKPVIPEVPEVIPDPEVDPTIPQVPNPENPTEPSNPNTDPDGGSPNTPSNPSPSVDGSGGDNPTPGNIPSNGSGSIATTTKENTSSTLETISQVVTDSAGAVLRSVRDSVNTIRQVIDDPRVEALNKRVIAPGVAIAAATNVAVGFQFSTLLSYLQYLFAQPLLLLRRRQRKQWSVVYNMYTKRPVDLAIVRLISQETGKVVQSQVTDALGRFFFIADPGKYIMEVQKQGYKGIPKAALAGSKTDGQYLNVYHGEDVDITNERKQTLYSVPLEPDIGQKSTAQILKEHSIALLREGISITGLVITGASFIISPGVYVGLLLAFHIFSYGLIRKFAYKPLGETYGIVTDYSSQKELGRVVVRIFDSAYDKLVSTTVTDRKGRYASLVGPSTYYSTYDKKGYRVKKSETLDYSSQKTNGLGGLVARDEKLQKDEQTS